MMRVHVRWLIQRDMPDVLRFESSLDDPWSREDILTLLRQRNCIGMVAEQGEKVVGYMLYELHERRIDLLRLVVCPRHRSLGVGRQMLEKIQSKLSTHRRSHIIADVPDGNLPAQKWLRACGWRAICVVRGDPDLYRFVLRVNAPSVLICEGR